MGVTKTGGSPERTCISLSTSSHIVRSSFSSMSSWIARSRVSVEDFTLSINSCSVSVSVDGPLAWRASLDLLFSSWTPSSLPKTHCTADSNPDTCCALLSSAVTPLQMTTWPFFLTPCNPDTFAFSPSMTSIFSCIRRVLDQRISTPLPLWKTITAMLDAHHHPEC